jgi:hypothetical protein
VSRSVFFGIVLVLSGCAVDVGASGATEGGVSALEGTVGVLEIDRRVDDEGALLTAAFARYHGLAESDVVSLVSSGARAELDTCTVVQGDVPLPLEADVELVDVGAIDVHLAYADAATALGGSTDSSRLVARTFPDVASVMAGVFYAGEAVLPLPQAERVSYVVRATGGRSVGAFQVSVAAPPEVDVHVYGDATGAVARDRALDFSWVPALTASAPDVVEIELASHGGTVVCSAADDGSFRVEPATLAHLGADSDAELVVRRVRTRAFGAAGLDSAFARIAITRTERIVVR